MLDMSRWLCGKQDVESPSLAFKISTTHRPPAGDYIPTYSLNQ